MLLNFTCQNCGGQIEVEAEQDGQTVACPHCHKTTVLVRGHRKVVAPVKPPASELPAPKLIACPACGHQISAEAYVCFECGHFPRGFFWLVWYAVCAVLLSLVMMNLLITLCKLAMSQI